MKAFLFAVSLVFALAPYAFSQTKVSLEIGAVDVWLGMPKQDVLKQFSQASYTVLNPDASESPIPILDAPKHAVGMVEFKGGKLSYASRSWGTCQQDCLATILAAFRSLADSTTGTCTLENAAKPKPDVRLDRISVVCGEHGLTIVTGKVDSVDVADVMEFIQ